MERTAENLCTLKVNCTWKICFGENFTAWYKMSK